MIDLNASPKLVPFGKYKGQPVEVLAQDKGYMDWVMSQDWFRERYPSFHTLIVNNFATDSETPEHNSLQVLFLDDAFCMSFIRKCKARWISDLRHGPINDARKRLKAELDGIKEQIDRYEKEIRAKGSLSHWEQPRYTEAMKRERVLSEAIHHLPEILNYHAKFTRQFEIRGVDVILDCTATSLEELPAWNGKHPHRDSKTLRIEIKPAVGDDYPAILRQMRISCSEYLFTQRYTGVGATKEQFVQTMKLSGIEVVFREDLDHEQHT